MKCGEFLKNAKQRALIQSPNYILDSIGGAAGNWITVGTYWAWLRPLSSGERYINEQLRGTTTHKIIIRYQSSLADVAQASSYRVTVDGRIYQINGIKNLDNTMKNYGKAYQELMVTENEVGLGG